MHKSALTPTSGRPQVDFPSFAPSWPPRLGTSDSRVVAGPRTSPGPSGGEELTVGRCGQSRLLARGTATERPAGAAARSASRGSLTPPRTRVRLGARARGMRLGARGPVRAVHAARERVGAAAPAACASGLAMGWGIVRGGSRAAALRGGRGGAGRFRTGSLPRACAARRRRQRARARRARSGVCRPDRIGREGGFAAPPTREPGRPAGRPPSGRTHSARLCPLPAQGLFPRAGEGPKAARIRRPGGESSPPQATRGMERGGGGD